MAAQKTTEKSNPVIENLISKADSAYGSHHELVNGNLFYQLNLYAKGSPFFMSDDWQNGSVVINGKEHTNVFLKYNINTDELILRPTLKNGMSTAIVLNTPFVESFQLGNNLFLNSENFGFEEVKSNFVHEIYRGSFNFFAAYKVVFVAEYNEKTPYGKYSDIIRSYFIFENGDVVKISSKKDLINYFEPYKKEIKRYMKKLKIRFNKASTGQWNELMTQIDGLRKTAQK